MNSNVKILIVTLLLCVVAVAAAITPAKAAPQTDLFSKVLGIPAPNEWIDVTSNAVGGPPTTFTVPVGKTLTLVELFPSGPFIDSPGDDRMETRVLVNGVYLGKDEKESIFLNKQSIWQFDPASGALRHKFRVGAVMESGEVLTVERTDVGDSVSTVWAFDAATFFVRGFLEDS